MLETCIFYLFLSLKFLFVLLLLFLVNSVVTPCTVLTHLSASQRPPRGAKCSWDFGGVTVRIRCGGMLLENGVSNACFKEQST